MSPIHELRVALLNSVLSVTSVFVIWSLFCQLFICHHMSIWWVQCQKQYLQEGGLGNPQLIGMLQIKLWRSDTCSTDMFSSHLWIIFSQWVNVFITGQSPVKPAFTVFKRVDNTAERFHCLSCWLRDHLILCTLRIISTIYFNQRRSGWCLIFFFSTKSFLIQIKLSYIIPIITDTNCSKTN